jgi:hypothetical protein
MSAPEHTRPHPHAHVHLDGADWAAWADQTELEGELFSSFVTDTAASIATLCVHEAAAAVRPDA